MSQELELGSTVYICSDTSFQRPMTINGFAYIGDDIAVVTCVYFSDDGILRKQKLSIESLRIMK